MIYLCIFVLIASGTYSVAASLLGYPPAASSKGVHLAVRNKRDGLIDNLSAPFVKTLAPLVRMQEYKEKRMGIQLARAGISLTPKEYVMRSLLMSGLALVLSSVFLLAAMRNMLVVSPILAVVVYMHFNGEVKDKLKDKDREIEAELPKFIRAIACGMKTEKDVIKLLETYQTIAGDGLKYDIEVLIMDLKSGNFEEGMIEFDKRLGNSYVSRLTKALILANKGDNQDTTLNYLLSDMGLLAKEMMQRELAKRPGRVKILVIPVVLIAVGALFYVIAMHLFTSLSGIM